MGIWNKLFGGKSKNTGSFESVQYESDGHVWVKKNKSDFDWQHDVDATVDDCVGGSAWRGWVRYTEENNSDEI